MANDGPLTIDADALLGTRAVEAGVSALAGRNRHHLASMAPEEQVEAANHWRELTVEVLSAARDALTSAGGVPEGAGRAVIVLEDSGGEEVNVHVTFAPQLEELQDGSIAGTPAQLAAMSLLESIAGEAAAEGGHGHSHDDEHGHGHTHD
ncbi:MAG TPA: hypothetical protein VI318_23145 [Baekduia sp.]